MPSSSQRTSQAVGSPERPAFAIRSGIVFLSGGQSDEDATAHLNIMNEMDSNPPWQLSYSYGRALQAAALKVWASGTPEDSQQAFSHRAKMNSLARSGDWSNTLEK